MALRRHYVVRKSCRKIHVRGVILFWSEIGTVRAVRQVREFVAENVPQNHAEHEEDEDDDAHHLQLGLPMLHFPVLQDDDADEESRYGPHEVRHVAHLDVARHVAVVDGDAGVDDPVREHGDEPYESDNVAVLGARGFAGAEALLHDDDVLLPVEDERGEVRGDEGVHASGGARQKDVGVDGRGAERAGHDAEDVDEAHPERAVTQLQRKADEELHDHVEQDVLNSLRETNLLDFRVSRCVSCRTQDWT